jgi:NAD(P)-dependent dehydrogenase (short-subunit alcohol dehydrogenase family)
MAMELLWNIKKTSLASVFGAGSYSWTLGNGGVCSIVNLDSSASYYGFQPLGAHTASKHAVLGLTGT